MNIKKSDVLPIKGTFRVLSVLTMSSVAQAIIVINRATGELLACNEREPVLPAGPAKDTIYRSCYGKKSSETYILMTL